MKFETFNKIYCTNLNNLKEKLKTFEASKYGSTSTIYEYNTMLIKIFKDAFIKEMLEYNDEFLINHKLIKKLDVKNIVKMKKALIYNKYFFGYTMEKFPGNRIIEIPEDTTFENLKKSLLQVEEDIKLLSKNNIIAYDINTSNLLYDSISNTSYIVDTDCYIIDMTESIDRITLDNKIELSLAVFNGILGNKKIYNERFIDNIRKKLFNKIETINGIEEFIDLTIKLVEEYSNNKINNIKTFRKNLILQKYN